MDKSWIELVDRSSNEYMNGIEMFLNFAYRNKDVVSQIYCPCIKCANRVYKYRATVKDHLEIYGFEKSYRDWTYHGDGDDVGDIDQNSGDDMVVDDVPVESSVGDGMCEMVREALGVPYTEDSISNEDVPEYFNLLKDAESELYSNCPNGITELSFIVELLHLKQLNKWTNRSFTMLLKFLKKVFPDAKLPKSYYQADKLTSDLGFKCETWDACPNSCMLFRNETKQLDRCDRCEASGYKNDVVSEDEQVQRVPIKRVRYFPLKSRLQKLFWSAKTASLMKWHAEKRIDDGVMRHPADSLAWKTFDQQNPSFANDSRNVRLGLASDGFNPFGNMSITHSTWPVILILYNLPPWLCMKQPYFIMSMLIDGPKGPGDKIDVFLQPLIDELKELWNDGVSTYDSSSKQFFQLHASLLWTISDFPAYANLSGWSTKGQFACPWCNVDPKSTWLTNGGKWCFWCHRRFLKPYRKFRRDKVNFNGKVELGLQPKKLSGSDVFQQLQDRDIETIYKKDDVFKKRNREALEKEEAKKIKKPLSKAHNWKKKSIFFELPYWEHNLIRHNLDVMHIEKNICDNVMFILLGSKGKTKDNLKARKDLQEMGIRLDLHPQPWGSNLHYIAPSETTMGKEEKDIFLKVLQDLKFPDGYASNISRCVHMQERTIWGLKSHDSHILLQQLLPIAVRKVLPKDVVKALIELSNCFKVLCSRDNTMADLDTFQDRVAVMLCSLEKIFPPAFFDIMEHLPIHLPDELLIAGPVLFRWMYPIERYLSTLKSYVRNRAHPEASIAKAICMEECMTFCVRYLDDNLETKSNRPLRNDDRGHVLGRGVGKGTQFRLDSTSWTQAHRYVLSNSEAVIPFIEKHLEILRQKYPNDVGHVHRIHNQQFHTWFRDYVKDVATEDELSDEIKSLALGPHYDGFRFKSYITRGFRFRTKEVDMRRKTQNSGVVLKAETMSYASRRDQNPCPGDVTYYGQLTDIIQVQYLNNMRFVLFKCNWVNQRVGLKKDEFNFTLVNFNHLLYKDNRPDDEPFILASQAEQVWYVQDPIETDWRVVVQMMPRNRFDLYSTTAEIEPEVIEVESFSMQQLDTTTTRESWVRRGVEGTIFDATIVEEDDVEGDNSDRN